MDEFFARSRQRQRRIDDGQQLEARPTASASQQFNELEGQGHIISSTRTNVQPLDESYVPTSTPQLPRREFVTPLPEFDVSAIPEPFGGDDEDSNSNMNVTIIENPQFYLEPAPTSFPPGIGQNAVGDVYTSDESNTASGSSGDNARSKENDGNNNTKNTVNQVASTASSMQRQSRSRPSGTDSDAEFMFSTALEFVDTPVTSSQTTGGHHSTPWASGFYLGQPTAAAPVKNTLTRQGHVTPSNYSSPPLLGAQALSPSHYFRLNQARKARNEAAAASESHLRAHVNNTDATIDDVLFRVQKLDIDDFSDSDDSDSIGDDPDYEVPVRVPPPAKGPKGRGQQRNRGIQNSPALDKYSPAELRGSVDHAIRILQQIISLIPSEDCDDELGTPASLAVELFPYQKYGLLWLWWREQHTPNGGILADEMGLGKTIMILALICRGLAERSKEGYRKGRRNDCGLILSRGTLVVCPASVMGQWELEVKKKCRRITVLVYHGPDRGNKLLADIANYHVVITTYDTLRSEVTNSAEYCNSPLIKIYWERVVLDEGHTIRNPAAGLTQSACRLNAKHRWVATGTPVHNKPADMFSLVKFLRLEPFDDSKTWNNWIGMKLSKGSDYERLNVITKSLMLRRTKEEVARVRLPGGSGLEIIPPKIVEDIIVELKPTERKIYNHLFSFAKQELRNFIKSQEKRTLEMQQAANGFIAGRSARERKAAGETKNFMSILTLLLRLKQGAVLPYLLSKVIDKSEDALNGTEEFDPVQDLMTFKNPTFSSDFESGKLEKVYQDLDQLKRRSKANKEPMEKVVIVSQWSTLLRVVDHQLKSKGYSTTTISGEVKIKDRTGIMQQFNENPKRPQIMLLSLGAGSVGLNLTGANHLYILDIHWNPQLELQAQDRIHRLGQRKPVTIHRYISQGTVEEKIVELQQVKLQLANSVLGTAQKKDGGALTVAEVRRLFGV